MTNVQALYRKIIAELRNAAGRRPKVARIVGHPEPIKSYGLTANRVREVFNRFAHDVAGLSLEQRFALAKLLLKTYVEEEGHMALGVLRLSVDEITPRQFDTLDALLEDFSTWSLVDDFATGKGGITAVLLERYPKETLRLHNRWVASSNMWKRRTSVVTFTRKTAADGKYIEETLRYCEALMRDPEDLVQKGVGWALKDTMRAGPAAKRRVLALVKRMRRDGVPSTITLYAIRDLKGAEREAILRIKPSQQKTRA